MPHYTEPFSDEALAYADLHEDDAVDLHVDRIELIERVRGEIAAGTYESPCKIAIAAERMFDDLNARALDQILDGRPATLAIPLDDQAIGDLDRPDRFDVQ